jgi:Uma2 family endonuclease
MAASSIIDRPEAREQLWPLSVEAYHALGEAGLIPERTELLYGFVFHKMPKSPFHRFLVQRLLLMLRPLIEPGFLLWSEQPIRCQDSEPEPDICVLTGCDEDYRNVHPTTAEMVIEVAISSEDYDRGKAAAYATAGVKEFWIMLASQKQIEIHSNAQSGAYEKVRVVAAGEAAVSSVLERFVVTPDALFAE